MTRRRLLVWALVFAVMFVAHPFLLRHLANQDPIGEVLLGRAGSVLPVAVLVLLLRYALFVLLPPFAALVAARIVLDEIARRSTGRRVLERPAGGEEEAREDVRGDDVDRR